MRFTAKVNLRYMYADNGYLRKECYFVADSAFFPIINEDAPECYG